ncbi:hypothetical protein AB0M29_33630 [Streptomyces sp. NPDC051976]|uniref:hypothetical protein n=1 Tax=Streptomyces sp. NPDC051976 TaxID=3154947 RepID=UPI0034243AB8
MRIRLVKQQTGGHLVTAILDDGVEMHVAETDHDHVVPHEISHLALEGTLGFAYGFWGCVSRGALFNGMRVLSGRGEQEALAVSQTVRKEAGARFINAEIMVAAIEENYPGARVGDVEECRELAMKNYTALSDLLAAADLPEATRRWAELVGAWADVPRGGAMERDWVSAAEPIDKDAPVSNQ